MSFPPRDRSIEEPLGEQLSPGDPPDHVAEGGGRAEAGIRGYPGPFPVGRYAGALRQRLRRFARVCVVGEVSGWRIGRGPNVYFELRDSDGGVPCAMWRSDFDRLGLDPADFGDGLEVVAAGGCDYYPGGATASPRFTFRVVDLRPAGEGDLLARLERLRRQLADEGLTELQGRLRRPSLPRTIGVVTAEAGAARRDLLAALERRAWRGTIVWAYAPVQDRRAAPAIAAAIRDLAAVATVETIVVTRGGGSIADLWAFCDEALCRTVALLPVPVVSAVGHEIDRTLLDDVAATCCSTPTHAAEAVVAVDCGEARSTLRLQAERLEALGRAALLDRARALGAQSRAPREHVARHRRELHQQTRELRAASRRGLVGRRAFQRRIAATVLERKVATTAVRTVSERATVRRGSARLERAAGRLAEHRAATLERHAAALRAADPERALERGYALVADAGGEPLTTAAAARAAGRLDLRMAGGVVPTEVRDSEAHDD